MTLTHKLKWYGAEVLAKERLAGFHGLMMVGFHIEEEAKRIVPIEEGTLSAQSIVSGDPVAMKVAVSFDTPYAVAQHEEMSYRHDAGRQAKYLEQPANETKSSGKMAAIIAATMKAELR